MHKIFQIVTPRCLIAIKDRITCEIQPSEFHGECRDKIDFRDIITVIEDSSVLYNTLGKVYPWLLYHLTLKLIPYAEDPNRLEQEKKLSCRQVGLHVARSNEQ